jgi:glutathione S-transferase
MCCVIDGGPCPSCFTTPAPARWRPHIVLEWIGAPYEAQAVEYGSAELLAVNPSGAVPTLIEDDGWILTQAGAILHYLAAQAPRGRSGRRHPARAARRNWTAGPAFSPATCIPASTRSSCPIAIPPARRCPKRGRARGRAQAGAPPAGHPERPSGGARLDAGLGKRSVIDAYAFPMIRWARKVLPDGMADWPNVQALHDRWPRMRPSTRSGPRTGQVRSRRMTTGIHHVTGITRRVQANVDFYTGLSGPAAGQAHRRL